MSEFSYIDGIIDGQTPDSMGRSPVQQAYQVNVQKSKKVSTNKVNFLDIFAGFKPTINGIVAMFFIGYALWLVVIYMIRHNEPLANQVLGTPTAGAPTAHADRIIVGGAKYALPINATGNQGFYTPDKKHHDIAPSLSPPQASLPTMGDPSSFSSQSQQALTSNNGAQGLPSSDGMAAAAYGHSRVVHEGRERYIIHHPEPLPGETPQHEQYLAAPQAVTPQSTFGAPAQAGGFAHHQLGANAYAPSPTTSRYNMPVQTQDGLKLRTVVNR
ncbi:hypothetical protein KF913_06785 [Candidatus Obscuribacterales bacterium]|nr:hypothetical protein [Candidatus Obscuribacterales bacterium]